jgi:hypothetical protein
MYPIKFLLSAPDNATRPKHILNDKWRFWTKPNLVYANVVRTVLTTVGHSECLKLEAQ